MNVRAAAFVLLLLAANACAQRANARFAAAPKGGEAAQSTAAEGFLDFDLEVPACGRYRCEIDLTAAADGAEVWVEDYIGNPDGRSYDVTGPIRAATGVVMRSGSPLDKGAHRMRLHHKGGAIAVRGVAFELLVAHSPTPASLTQRTDDGEWTIVWSDEFDGDGPVDETRWAYDIGDWGWGNRELQRYTARDQANARRENGNLVIEAHRVGNGPSWTSARLTTRGKISFLRGRIEIRAKAPAVDGAWAAGWLLGDAYRDEKSWPYCGEIDVFEAVGREIDDTSGDGKNHASCHTRAYYFKQGNHISQTRLVPRMAGEFHVYTLDWCADRVEIAVDGERYYVYDKNKGPLEWPFADPQCLILNLAMGGGMGGEVDPKADRAQFVVDYVRVFGRR